MGQFFSVMDQLLALGNATATAGQAIRRKLDNTGWEFYTPVSGATYVSGTGITIDGSNAVNLSAGTQATLAAVAGKQDTLTSSSIITIGTLTAGGNVNASGNYQISGSVIVSSQVSLGNKYFGGGGNQTATGTNNLGIGKGALINLATDSNKTIISNVSQSNYANELLYSPIVITNATTSGTAAGQVIRLNSGGTLTVVTSSGTLNITGSTLSLTSVGGTTTLLNGSINLTGSIEPSNYRVGGMSGWSGNFATNDGRTAYVIQGLVTDVS